LSEKIYIPQPIWGSNLANIILNLEKLRNRQLVSEIPPYLFFQIKNIFQMMETLGSARIEGNNTTLSEYVEKLIENDGSKEKDEKSQELANIEAAAKFIEENTNAYTKIDRAYISQLHKIITFRLTPPPEGEGSRYPGELRKENVAIKRSKHTPPIREKLMDYFEKFVEFINIDHIEQNQLLMVAMAHHRFMYIHPFDNGNGRMGRLLNYAFLIKLGFNVKTARILNPSSVFYTDREKYYDMLSRADSMSDTQLLEWCEYFLLGLKNEIEKIDKITERDFVKEKILIPAIKLSLERKYITDNEYDILNKIINSKGMAIKSADLSDLGFTTSQQKTYAMSKLRERKMVMPTENNGRIYTICFSNNYLLRSIMQVLSNNGFVADFLNTNK